jgi:hypothetical protein
LSQHRLGAVPATPASTRVVALENDVRRWIWTKTAEDILQSPSKYIAKISDAGH